MTTSAHIATLVAVLACTFAAGCSTDVQLGVAREVPPDASSTVDGWVAGAQVLMFETPVFASCNGTLAGREAEFASQSFDDLGLVDAPVTVTLISDEETRIGGAGLASSFHQTLLPLLRTTIGSGGSYRWSIRVEDDFGTGPAGAMNTNRELEFEEPIRSPGEGSLRLRYELDASSCEVFVPVTLVP